MDLLNSAASAAERATTQGTQAKRARAWRLWQECLPSIGVEGDDLLETFDDWNRQIICICFAQAVRNAEFNQRRIKVLAAGTVIDSLSYVAQAFRSVNRPDPTLDTDGARCFMLQQIYRGYKNIDPPKQQKALPVSVLRKMHNVA